VSAFLVLLTSLRVEDTCPESTYIISGSIDPLAMLSPLDLNPLLYCTKAEARSFYECGQSISRNSQNISTVAVH